MAQTSGETKFTLRLVFDEEKKKVVFVEACRDFVDVLFSLLTLPMGTIVRLLENHRKSQTVNVGCFTNLYRSVVDLDIHHFETEACKQMLLYPRSTKEVQCKRLKVNINPTEGVKYFKCNGITHCKMCSNFSTSRCRCGRLMNEEIEVRGGNVVENKHNYDANGVFVRGKSSFIITDDLKVEVRSTDLVLKKLKTQGYGDISKVGEKLVDISLEKVVTLLESIFSSDTPLTDAFLNKQTAQAKMEIGETLSPSLEEKRDESEVMITLSAVVRKHDMKVLYVECGQDFVDLLFTFLAVPMESVLEISSNISTYGCIGNLFGSFKGFSVDQKSKELTSKLTIPHYYTCEKKLLNNIITEQPPVYYYYNTYLTKDCLGPMVLVTDPKSHGSKQSTEGSGFVKRDTRFIVFDDLSITPMNSSSTICVLKKFKIRAEDLGVQEISISQIEAMSLLRASLVTSSALNTCLKNLLVVMNSPVMNFRRMLLARRALGNQHRSRN